MDYKILTKLLELLLHDDRTVRDQGLGLLEATDDPELWEAVLKDCSVSEVKHYGQTSMRFTNRVYKEHNGLFRAFCLNPHKQHEAIEALSLKEFNGDHSAELAEVLPSIRHLSKLTELSIVRCKDLVDLQELGSLPELKTLVIEDCDKLQSLKLVSLPHLETLVIRRCQRLKGFDIEALPELKSLSATDCGKLENLEGIQGSISLKELTLLKVPNLANLQSLASLESIALTADFIPGLDSEASRKFLPGSWLKSVIAKGDFEELPELGGFEALESLSVGKVAKKKERTALVGVCGLAGLGKLRKLDICLSPSLGDDLKAAGWTKDGAPTTIKDVKKFIGCVGEMRNATERTSVGALMYMDEPSAWLKDLRRMPQLKKISGTLHDLNQLPDLEIVSHKIWYGFRSRRGTATETDKSLHTNTPAGVSRLIVTMPPKVPASKQIFKKLFDTVVWTKLKALELHGIQSIATRAMADLQHMPEFEELVVQNCPLISDISFAKHAPGLRVLRLLNQPSVNMAALAKFPKLRLLDLSGTVADWSEPGSLKALAALSELEEIRLGKNTSIFASAPEDGILKGIEAVRSFQTALDTTSPAAAAPVLSSTPKGPKAVKARSAIRKQLGSSDITVVRKGCALFSKMMQDEELAPVVRELAAGCSVNESGRIEVGPEVTKRVKEDSHYTGIKNYRELVALHALVAAGIGASVEKLVVPGGPTGGFPLLKPAVLSSMVGLTHLNLLGCDSTFKKIDGIDALTQLRLLELPASVKCKNLEIVKPLQHLETLNVLEGSALTGLTDLAALPKLKRLTIVGLRKTDGLSNLVGLEYLSLRGILSTYGESSVKGAPLKDTALIATLHRLVELDLSGCAKLENLDDLKGLPIEVLHLKDCTKLKNVDGLTGLTKLRELDLSDCPKLENLDGLRGLPIEKLVLENCPKLENQTGLSEMPELKELRMLGTPVNDTAVFANLAQLTGLELGVGYQEKRDGLATEGLGFLSGLSNLQTLKIINWKNLQCLEGLEDLENIKTLDLRGCTRLHDLRGLAGLPKLDKLDLSKCESVVDISPIAKLPLLSQLSWSRPNFTPPPPNNDKYGDGLQGGNRYGLPPNGLKSRFRIEVYQAIIVKHLAQAKKRSNPEGPLAALLDGVRDKDISITSEGCGGARLRILVGGVDLASSLIEKGVKLTGTPIPGSEWAEIGDEKDIFAFTVVDKDDLESIANCNEFQKAFKQIYSAAKSVSFVKYSYEDLGIRDGRKWDTVEEVEAIYRDGKKSRYG